MSSSLCLRNFCDATEVASIGLGAMAGAMFITTALRLDNWIFSSRIGGPSLERAMAAIRNAVGMSAIQFGLGVSTALGVHAVGVHFNKPGRPFFECGAIAGMIMWTAVAH